MKKVLSAFLAAAVVFTCALSMQLVSMADGEGFANPQYVAKQGDATVDGTVNASEYGATFVADASNSSSWNNGTDCPTVDWNFAYSSKGLYIAITSPSDTDGNFTYQVQMSPKSACPGDGHGMFFSIASDSVGGVGVTRYYYETSTDMGSPATITDQCTGASASSDSGSVIELFIPTAELDCMNADDSVDFTDFVPTAGTTMPFATYVIGNGQAWSTIMGAGSSDVGTYLDQAQSLGTLTFQAPAVVSSSAPASSTPASSEVSSAPASSAVSSEVSSAPASSAVSSAVSSEVSSAPASSAASSSAASSSKASSSKASSSSEVSSADSTGGWGDALAGDSSSEAASSSAAASSSQESNVNTGANGGMAFPIALGVLALGAALVVFKKKAD